MLDLSGWLQGGRFGGSGWVGPVRVLREGRVGGPLVSVAFVFVVFVEVVVLVVIVFV